MWRKYFLLVLLAILVVGGAFFLSQSAATPNESDYVKAVKSYQAISIDEVEQKVQDEEEFILYTRGASSFQNTIKSPNGLYCK
ncbi:TPA: hypothetical protein ACT2FK_001498 [Streptococcus suis]